MPRAGLQSPRPRVGLRQEGLRGCAGGGSGSQSREGPCWVKTRMEDQQGAGGNLPKGLAEFWDRVKILSSETPPFCSRSRRQHKERGGPSATPRLPGYRVRVERLHAASAGHLGCGQRSCRSSLAAPRAVWRSGRSGGTRRRICETGVKPEELAPCLPSSSSTGTGSVRAVVADTPRPAVGAKRGGGALTQDGGGPGAGSLSLSVPAEKMAARRSGTPRTAPPGRPSAAPQPPAGAP